MGFSLATITDGPNPAADGLSLALSWSSSSPEGTVFQLYQDGRLVYHGTGRRCVLPMPAHRAVHVVGTVGDGESDVDFSASLPSPGAARVTLKWRGGTYLSPTIRGFNVYSNDGEGGSIDYEHRVGRVNAYGPGIVTDGYGCGGYGEGGYGIAAAHYEWTSAPLGSGTYQFAVRPYDEAGLEGTASTITQAVASPPPSPGPAPSGPTLTYTYNPATRVPTLHWPVAGMGGYGEVPYTEVLGGETGGGETGTGE